MKYLFRFLAKSKTAVAGILLLLLLQAYCDLALPDLTSDILNVGLSQGGIEDAVPDTLRTEAAEDLKLFLTEEESTFFDFCYEAEEGTDILKLKKGTERAQLYNSRFEQAG